MSRPKLEVFMRESVCSGCLNVNRNLTVLKKCDLFILLLSNGLSHKSLRNIKVLLCWECLAILRKIEKFQNRVHQAQKILHNYSQLEGDEFTNFLNCSQTKLHRIERSKNELTWITNGNNIEYEVIDSVASSLIDIKMDVKNESDFEGEILEEYASDHDFKNEDSVDDKIMIENETFEYRHGLDIKVDPAEVKNVAPKQKINTQKVYKSITEKYHGKIEVITLTNEELIAEREQERNSKYIMTMPYHCTDCLVAFSCEKKFTDHKNTQHKQVDGCYVCDICALVWKSKHGLIQHFKRHFRRYRCLGCGKRSKGLRSLLYHYNKHHGDIPLVHKCAKCDYTTDSLFKLSSHRKKQHARTKHTCETCSAPYRTKRELHMHMRKTHGITLTFVCDICGKVYNREGSLYAHKQTHKHTEQWCCADCGTVYRNANALAAHLKTMRHIPEIDKCECGHCSKVFKTKRSLEEHVLYMHLKKIKVSCHLCSKSYKRKSGLMAHIKSFHEKVQPTKRKICDYCGQLFSTTRTLRGHLYTHTGVRYLQCPECPKSFGNHGAFWLHKKKVHNIKTQTKRK